MKRATLLTATFIIFTILGSSLTYAQNLQVENDTYTVYLPLIIQHRPPESDDYEPDDDWDNANEILTGVPQNHSIYPIGDVDFMTFTLTGNPTQDTYAVVLVTSGPYWYQDTILKLFDEDKYQIGTNDDYDPANHLYSKIDRVCGDDALVAGTYFIKVYSGDGVPRYLRYIIPDYNISFTASPCP